MNKQYEQWKEEFVERVRARLRSDSELKTKGDVCIQIIRQVNMGTREGLVMPDLNESGASPVIYLDELYEHHQKGMPDEMLAQGVVAQFSHHRGMVIDTSMLLDYEKVKDRLRIRVSGREKNEHWAEEKICVMDGDFIQSCYLDFRDPDGGYVAVNIMKGHADVWNIPYEQVLADARKGTETVNVELRSVMCMLNLAGSEQVADDYFLHPERLPEDEHIFVLREKDSPFGAAVIARPEVLAEAAEVLKGDYYVLPSSVEEVLLIPAKCWDDPEKLNQMVREINEEMVEPRNHLSNHVQYYDREKKRMMNAVEYRYQKRSQERMDGGRVMARKRHAHEDYER